MQAGPAPVVKVFLFKFFLNYSSNKLAFSRAKKNPPELREILIAVGIGYNFYPFIKGITNRLFWCFNIRE